MAHHSELIEHMSVRRVMPLMGQYSMEEDTEISKKKLSALDL